MKIPSIYIITNKPYGTLYIGVTSNLSHRIELHKKGVVDGFSKKYNLNSLVYYEILDSMYSAIEREKQLKNWRREWKVNLIDKFNSQWKDLLLEL